MAVGMDEVLSKGMLIRGHGVASGKNPDPRFPAGTLAMQKPFFLELGLDLGDFYPGTLNLSVAPCLFVPGNPTHSFPGVKWSPSLPAENFSFYSCRIRPTGEAFFVEALVYWPHPSTKPEFHQDPHVIEILAPELPRVGYGQEVELSHYPEDMSFALPEG